MTNRVPQPLAGLESKARDPRLLPMVAAAFVGPVGLWWWARQQPQAPNPLAIRGTFLLWGAQLTAAWWLLPPIGRLQQPLFYAWLFANLTTLSWLLGVLFAPPGEQALEGSYWWGFGLNLLALESWLAVLHPLSRYASQPVQHPALYVGIPALIGLGWLLTLRSALTGPRQPALLENKRAASALGWLLCAGSIIVIAAFSQVIRVLSSKF